MESLASNKGLKDCMFRSRAKAFRPIVVVDGPRYLSPTSALKDPGCCGKRGCPGHWLNIDTDRAREIEKEREREGEGEREREQGGKR